MLWLAVGVGVAIRGFMVGQAGAADLASGGLRQLAGALPGGHLPAGTVAAAPTTITARELTYDYRKAVATFEGEVVVEDAQIHMTCDRLIVIFDGTNEVKSVTAFGRVRMRNADRLATAERAVYLARSGEIILTGQAKVERGADFVSGEEIRFWIDEERIVSKGPARLVFQPAQGNGPVLMPVFKPQIKPPPGVSP